MGLLLSYLGTIASAIWKFLKTPANVLSVVAIVATVVVPFIDKIAKADDELRTQLTALTEATNTVIASNEGILQTGPGVVGSQDSQKYSVALAKRENDLHRAVSIADSILGAAYPSILVALARELCHDNDAKHAKRFSDEVIRRAKLSREDEQPKASEVAQANVAMATCIVYRGTLYAPLTSTDKAELEARMQAAVAVLGTAAGRAAKIDLAGLHFTWAEMERALGNSEAAEAHLKSGEAFAKAVDHPETWLTKRLEALKAPASAPDVLAPGFSGAATFDVTFPDAKETTATLIFVHGSLPDAEVPDAVLLVYRNGLLQDGLTLRATTLTNGVVTKLHWQRDFFSGGTNSRTLSLRDVWLVEHYAPEAFDGVQASVGKPSLRFSAALRKRST